MTKYRIRLEQVGGAKVVDIPVTNERLTPEQIFIRVTTMDGPLNDIADKIMDGPFFLSVINEYGHTHKTTRWEYSRHRAYLLVKEDGGIELAFNEGKEFTRTHAANRQGIPIHLPETLFVGSEK